jgi:hypothetical protein
MSLHCSGFGTHILKLLKARNALEKLLITS